jgi:hypothetical protein
MTVTVDPHALPTMALFLHMYQPPIPIQTFPILKRIIEKSYLPVTQGLLENSDIRLTININASLTEMLVEHSPQVLDNLILLAESNQIEFVESAAYHTILPLLPAKFQEIQIKLNNKINRKILGTKYKPIGFFPPELAVDQLLPSFLNKLGYQYCIFPSTAFPSVTSIGIPYLKFKDGKFHLLPRNRTLSNDIAFKRFSTAEDIAKAVAMYSEGNELATPIIGMDFETFGEHHQKYEKMLFEAAKRIRCIQLQDLIHIHEFSATDFSINEGDFRASSWSTTEEDNRAQIPFPLWDYPTNSLHQLTLLLMNLLSEATNYIDNPSIDDLLPLLKSQQSCQLWWESEGRFGPDLVKRAIDFQINALATITMLANSQNGEKLATLQTLLKCAQMIVDRINKIINIRSQ